MGILDDWESAKVTAKAKAKSLLDWFDTGAGQSIEDMNAALTGYRVKPGAELTDAGWVDSDALAQGRWDSGLEREPDTMRAMSLFGSAGAGARVGGKIAAKAGAEGKIAQRMAQELPIEYAAQGAERAGSGLPPLGAQQESLTAPVRQLHDVPMSAGESTTTNADSVLAWLRSHGIDANIEHSRSFSDRHGPSVSAYITANGKKVRVSDHYYPTGSDIDLRVGTPFHESEAGLAQAFGLPMSDAAKAVAEKRAAELAAFEAEREKFNAEIARKAERDKLLIDNGYIDSFGRPVTGKARKRALSKLLSGDNADLLAAQANIGPLVQYLLRGDRRGE